jgi:hypothetical protein
MQGVEEMVRIPVLLLSAGLVVSSAGHASADVILDWNNVYLNVLRQTQGGPGFMSRTGAMVHAAMFNAVNAVDQSHFAYDPAGNFNPGNVAGASREAAAAVAAHRVMSGVYAGSPLQGYFDSTLASSLAAIPEGPAKSAGMVLGDYAGVHMLNTRQNDGWDADPSYTPVNAPGFWQPTQAGDPISPHWGKVQTWGMMDGAQFRPNRLMAYGTMENFLQSQEYADNYNGNAELGIPGVKDLGRVDRWTPDDEEYKIAFFWGNDRDGTYHPPGHLNEITQVVAAQQFAGMTPEERLSQHARLFALTNIAMADAGIAAWDCKYETPFDLWRPITGIQNAHLDGNPQTISDPAWEPLNHVDPDGPGPMLPDPFSPQFPAYISGHATFGAAHAAVMAAFFGTDEITFTVGTDDPYVPEGYTRTFNSFSEAAWENALSRIYLGVHWYIDAVDGNQVGYHIGDWIFAHYLQEVPAPGAGLLLALGGAAAGFRRRRS